MSHPSRGLRASTFLAVIVKRLRVLITKMSGSTSALLWLGTNKTGPEDGMFWRPSTSICRKKRCSVSGPATR